MTPDNTSAEPAGPASSTDAGASSSPASSDPAEQQPVDRLKRLTRSRDERMIAGVCGGLAEATDTDPILFRVVLAVLVFFGGVGALLYLAAWLLLPADDETASPVGALLGRGRSATGPVLTVVLALVGVAFLAWSPGRGFPGSVVLLTVLALAGYLLLRRRPDPVVTAQPPAPTTPPVAHQSTGDAGGDTAPAKQLSISHLTLALACLVTAGMASTQIVSDIDIPVAGYFAVSLAITAAGLIVGTWLGRGRALIALAAVLSVGLGASTVAGEISDREVTWRPATMQELRTLYNLEAGDATLDLRRLRYDRGENRTVDVEVGVGSLTVRLPGDTDTDVGARVGVGKLDLLGESSDGAGLSEYRNAVGENAGALRLDLNLGVGHLEVTR